MPRNRKCYLPNSLIELCFRAEEGLPLVATPYIKAAVLSILARAQSFYPVGIVAYVVMSNHVHMLLNLEQPYFENP